MAVHFAFVAVLAFFSWNMGEAKASALMYERAATEVPSYVFKYGNMSLEASGTA